MDNCTQKPPRISRRLKLQLVGTHNPTQSPPPTSRMSDSITRGTADPDTRQYLRSDSDSSLAAPADGMYSDELMTSRQSISLADLEKANADQNQQTSDQNELNANEYPTQVSNTYAENVLRHEANSLQDSPAPIMRYGSHTQDGSQIPRANTEPGRSLAHAVWRSRDCSSLAIALHGSWLAC